MSKIEIKGVDILNKYVKDYRFIFNRAENVSVCSCGEISIVKLNSGACPKCGKTEYTFFTNLISYGKHTRTKTEKGYKVTLTYPKSDDKLINEDRLITISEDSMWIISEEEGFIKVNKEILYDKIAEVVLNIIKTEIPSYEKYKDIFEKLPIGLQGLEQFIVLVEGIKSHPKLSQKQFILEHPHFYFALLESNFYDTTPDNLKSITKIDPKFYRHMDESFLRYMGDKLYYLKRIMDCEEALLYHLEAGNIDMNDISDMSYEYNTRMTDGSIDDLFEFKRVEDRTKNRFYLPDGAKKLMNDFLKAYIPTYGKGSVGEFFQYITNYWIANGKKSLKDIDWSKVPSRLKEVGIINGKAKLMSKLFDDKEIEEFYNELQKDPLEAIKKVYGSNYKEEGRSNWKV